MSHQLIVAIGRESGSGGLDIAHALAERLQLPLFDKSILQKAAEDKGVSAETLERYDERPYSPLFCRSVRGISSAPEDCVAQMQFELLRQHANAGESFVVLGRCAEEVLADREGLISIFVRADLDFRVKRTPLPEEEALDFIKHQDRQRRIYHDQHCKGDWGDAKCYDLVINSARLTSPAPWIFWNNTSAPGPLSSMIGLPVNKGGPMSVQKKKKKPREMLDRFFLRVLGRKRERRSWRKAGNKPHRF